MSIKKIKMLYYVDDVVIINYNRDQIDISKLEKYFEKFGLSFNKDKTFVAYAHNDTIYLDTKE